MRCALKHPLQVETKEIQASMFRDQPAEELWYALLSQLTLLYFLKTQTAVKASWKTEGKKTEDVQHTVHEVLCEPCTSAKQTRANT